MESMHCGNGKENADKRVEKTLEMMTAVDAVKICRKCGTENRVDNSYCRKCGVVLDISTTAINAQPKPVTPESEGIRWRYVWLGIFVLLGLTCCTVGAAAIAGVFLDVGQKGLEGIVDDLFQVVTLVGVLFLVAFGLGGIVMAWLSRRSVTREVLISTVIVIGLLGAAGSVITSDIIIVAGIVVLPSSAAAWLGTKARVRTSKGDTSR